MDKKLFEQYVREIKKARLSNDEKSAIRQSLLSFILQNPLKPGINPQLSIAPSIFSFSHFARFAMVAMFLLVAVGGGFAVGAEKALPGDALYAVKVGFNEEVRSILKISEVSKANWEVERAQRRLEEIEIMAVDGSLNVETREKIEANFEVHTERVKKRIKKFENKENFKAAVDVSSKFEASLKAHEKILGRISNEGKEDIKKEVKPIERRVRSEADNSTKVRKKMELRESEGVDKNRDDEKEDDDNDDDDEKDSEDEGDGEINLENESNRGSLRTRLGF